MGFTLRFMLGLFVILAICSKFNSASTWHRTRRLSEASTLEPIDKSGIGENNGSTNEEEHKPKTDVNSTDEANKIISEINNKEEDVEPLLFEDNIDRPFSVTENDLSKESVEATRAAHAKSIDLNIDIQKYLSPDFHDKNNVYKIPTSPDIEKYTNLGSEFQSKTASVPEATTNYDFDKKLRAVQNDINKKLVYIDEKPLRSTVQYEETSDSDALVQLNLVKYKNATFVREDGNNVHKDEELESKQNLDTGSSYNHTLFYEQNHILRQQSVSEASLDNQHSNETEDSKTKIFKAKATTDPEVTHPKLNQTERRTALLSNKIEHDNTNEGRLLKWTHRYVSSTVPSSETTGQKEEVLFVPYTKENPINISKRGSTKFIDAVTSQRPDETVQFKENKTLDEAAVENQIYPVQVPAPTREPKEETTENISVSNSTGKNNTQTTTQNTSPSKITTSTESLTTQGISDFITSNVVIPETTKKPNLVMPSSTLSPLTTNKPENATLKGPGMTDESNSTSSGSSPTTENSLERSTLNISTKDEDNFTSFTHHGKIEEESSTLDSSTSATNEEALTFVTASPGVEENSTLSSTLLNPSSAAGETGTVSSTHGETTSTEALSTTGDYISDQTTIATVNEASIPQNITLAVTTSEPANTTKLVVQQTETATFPTKTEYSTTVIDKTTTPLNSSSQPSTTSNYEEFKIPTKLDEDYKSTFKVDNRTSSGRELRNFTTPSEPTTRTESDKEKLPHTTIDYRDNVIKHSDRVTTTTEPIVTYAPTRVVHTGRPLIERKQNVSRSTPEPSAPELNTSEPITSEDTPGNGDLSPEDQESNGGKIAAVVISCIGALCFIILAVLLFVMRKRHKRFNYGQRCTPVSLDSYSVDNVSVHNSIRRKGMMRASKRSYGNPAFDESSVTHLLNFPELMKFGNNTEGIASEYDEIPQISVQTNELPEGCEIKNRYANVIPLPESRVFLSTTDNCPNSDYINANFVTGPKSTRNYYIACQAPMQSTVDDFWRMIWEQQSRVILMLTHLFENGAEKCFDYLPPSEVLDCHRLFGDFQITLKKREVKEKYVISSLQLKNMVSNTWREVTHLWYLGWPERGVPTEESSLVAFLIEARSYVKSAPSENGKLREPSSNGASHSEHSPVVIHCSPGTGRTGTVIACDIAIREFELTRQVDIPKTVYKIRRNRAGAVQTREQYTLIYKVITWYANKLTGGVLDSL